jgi:hypothetical protein
MAAHSGFRAREIAPRLSLGLPWEIADSRERLRTIFCLSSCRSPARRPVAGISSSRAHGARPRSLRVGAVCGWFGERCKGYSLRGLRHLLPSELDHLDGSTDVAGRIVAERMRPLLGQPVIIETIKAIANVAAQRSRTFRPPKSLCPRRHSYLEAEEWMRVSRRSRRDDLRSPRPGPPHEPGFSPFPRRQRNAALRSNVPVGPRGALPFHGLRAFADHLRPENSRCHSRVGFGLIFGVSGGTVVWTVTVIPPDSDRGRFSIQTSSAHATMNTAIAMPTTRDGRRCCRSSDSAPFSTRFVPIGAALTRRGHDDDRCTERLPSGAVCHVSRCRIVCVRDERPRDFG